MYYIKLYDGKEKKIAHTLFDAYDWLNEYMDDYRFDENRLTELGKTVKIFEDREFVGTIGKLKLGHFNMEESEYEGFDIAIWNCPYCEVEKYLEPDAHGVVTCDECNEEFLVRDIICML